METPTQHKPLRCVVVTPERAALDEVCDFIAVPMYDGELGVLPGRLPLIGRLGCGELRIGFRGLTRRLFVDGGFVQIKNNIVTVLTGKAIKGEDISISEVEKALQSATGPSTDPDSQLKAQDRARAQLRVAHHTTDKPGLSLEGL